MGHYDDCYEYQEQLRIEKQLQDKNYIKWAKWRNKFLNTKMSELTVAEYIEGRRRLTEYEYIEVDEKNVAS